MIAFLRTSDGRNALYVRADEVVAVYESPCGGSSIMLRTRNHPLSSVESPDVIASNLLSALNDDPYAPPTVKDPSC